MTGSKKSVLAITAMKCFNSQLSIPTNLQDLRSSFKEKKTPNSVKKTQDGGAPYLVKYFNMDIVLLLLQYD